MKAYQLRRSLLSWPSFYVFAGLAALGGMASAPGVTFAAAPDATIAAGAARRAIQRIVQDDDQGEEAEVPSAQVEKYVAVYKAMQSNRSLTVEKAAARQGMTVEQFRDLENRIQRDESAMQHVRDELQASAARAPASSSTPR